MAQNFFKELVSPAEFPRGTNITYIWCVYLNKLNKDDFFLSFSRYFYTRVMISTYINRIIKSRGNESYDCK